MDASIYISLSSGNQSSEHNGKKQHLKRPSTGSRTITTILAFGVIAAMRLATCGKHACTGQASKHCHCRGKKVAKDLVLDTTNHAKLRSFHLQSTQALWLCYLFDALNGNGPPPAHHSWKK
jgi:hypothetical protein